jgi:hypothetical protein
MGLHDSPRTTQTARKKSTGVGLVKRAPESFAKAIELFASKAELAAAIGRPESTVRSWHARNSIPPRYFDLIGAAAKRLHVPVSSAQLWAILNARAQAEAIGE